MVALSTATLDTLAVPTPSYDRSQVTTGIVHFGVGGFHRSHEAMYLDRLMNQGKALDWGICGIGVLPGDRQMQQVMAAQDCLYTLVLKHPDGHWEPRIVGSIVQYLYAPDDPDTVIEKLAEPSTRVVSLTVTEGGYNIDHVTGEFDPDAPAIAADLAPDAVPATVFGLITEALSRRRARGVPAFTIMSCDNIQGNGTLTRRAFVAYARLRDPDLADWVNAQVQFPNSMVDRITPATTDADRDEIARRYDINDAWPVLAEPFDQWVLEDHFTTGRPPLENAGVQLTDHVEPYELMKLRLLNASHQVMSYLGYLAGHRYVDDVTRDPAFTRFLLDYMHREAIPTLSPVPGIDLNVYCDQLIERFGNAGVRDTLARNCALTSDRIPVFLLPVIREQLASGGELTRAAITVASWARYGEGVDENGQPIEVIDRLREQLQPLVQRQADDPTAFLSYRELFGDLIDNPRFVALYTAALDSLHQRGAAATVATTNNAD